jgi:hypothetical protein
MTLYVLEQSRHSSHKAVPEWAREHIIVACVLKDDHLGPECGCKLLPYRHERDFLNFAPVK